MNKPGIEEIVSGIGNYKKSFTLYNDSRIASLKTSLASEELVNLFYYIPFLFTVNSINFPGYVEEMEEPPGISGYSIPAGLMNKIRMADPDFIPAKTGSSGAAIRLVALIGSAGTVAFTPESDFDFWLCGNFDQTETEKFMMLRKKCRLIENWVMETYGKEIHFFLNDINRVKRNIFDDDEEYGFSGTSLGQLLKEEFYRSSIVISGAIPFWWVVPSDSSDREYREWFEAMQDGGLDNDFVDLGNLPPMKRGDFLISALFQIVKSLGNPFKSIIKLGLLEKYIYDRSATPFISNLIKKNVHNGITDRASIDAYCIMFDQVYEYYQKFQDDLNSINVIKTCFYLKVNPRLSETPEGPEDKIRREIMSGYVKNWGWDRSIVKHVDNFENWDIESTNKLMNNTKKKILKGYKNILNAIGSELNAETIDKDSLVGINRKIFSHFKPEENKVDNTLNFKKYPPEKMLSLDFITDIKSNDAWYLNKRTIARGRSAKILISKNRHLLSLIVWISLNGLYQKNFTRLEVDQGFYQMDPGFIRELISELSTNFSMKNLNLQNSYFLRDPFPVMSYFIINPFHKYSRDLYELYFLYHNSWGETRFEFYRGIDSVPPLLERVINGALNSGMDAGGALNIIASEPYRSSKEYRALRGTLKDVLEFFITGNQNEKQRFLTMIGNRRIVFSNRVKRKERPVISFYSCEGDTGMLFTMSYNRGLVNLIKADGNIPEFKYLSEMLSCYSPDRVNIFFEDIGRRFCRFFVLNERGSLMLFRKKSEYLTTYLAGLISFTESVLSSTGKVDSSPSLKDEERKIRVHKIETVERGELSIKEYDYEQDMLLNKTGEKLIPVTLSLHLLDSGEVGYRFTLPDGDPSEIFSRAGLEEASRDLGEIMKSVENYYYFPTSVNLDRVPIRLYKSYTSFAFSEKNRFETLIEKNIG